MTRLVFDINEPIYPSGDLLIRLTNQMYQEGTTYLAGRPMGTGQIVVDKDQDFVTATNFAVGNYVIVRDLDLSADDADNAVGGFWLEEGDFTLVSDDPKVLTFGGRSTIAVLERAIMGPVALDPEWPDNVTEDGYWRWGAMTYGGVMRRALFEANLQDPPGLPMIETSHVGVDDVWWDDDDDSNGNAWPSFAGEFRTQCGTTLLELYRELYGYGVQIEIDPQSFEMYAFNPDGYGTNRTSATFASGKVRFVAGINIAADLTRSIHGRLRTTHLLVRTTDYPEGAWIESDDYVDGDPVYKRVYQSGDISGDPSASTVLQSRAQRNMDLRLSGEDGVRIPLAKTDFEPLSGKYHAGPNFAVGPAVTTGHFWYGDLITLDTGDHTMDYQDASKRVEAIEYVLREAGDWDVVVHLGPRVFLQNSSLTSTAGATGNTLPITLCDPTVEGDEAVTFADWTWSTGPLTGGFNNYEQSVAAYVINGVTQAAFTHSNGLNNTEANFRSNGAGTYIPEDSKYFPCTAGVPVNVSCLVGTRNTGFVETRELKIRFENAAGVLLGTETTIHSDTGSGFVAASGTYTPPVSAVKFRLWVRGRVDDLILSTGTATETENPHAGTSHLAARCDHTHDPADHDHDTEYSDAAHAHPANTVVIEDAGAYFTGTDVEAALQELAVGGSSGLPWFDVTAYGAVGDGVTDDTAEINLAIAAWNTAGTGVLYFPGTVAGYLISGALTTITARGTVLGDGQGKIDGTDAGTAIICSDGSVSVFTFAEHSCEIRGLSLLCADATPTAGGGIKVTAGDHFRIRDVTVFGFYDNVDIEDGAHWSASGLNCIGPARYGLRTRHVDLPDGGDWAISDSWFGTYTHDATAAIRQESGGGGKLTNVKINMSPAGVAAKRYTDGISVAIGSGNNTSILTMSSVSIENVSGDAIDVSTTGTGVFYFLVIDGVQVGLYGNSTGRAVKVTAASAGGITVAGGIGLVSIDGLSAYTDGTARDAVELTNVDTVTYGDRNLLGFTGGIAGSGNTNVTDGGSSGATDLDDLTDVTITSPATGDMVRFNGTAWVDTPGRWEVVTNGTDILVWDGVNLLHEWTET